jgi:hypothetical protein
VLDRGRRRRRGWWRRRRGWWRRWRRRRRRRGWWRRWRRRRRRRWWWRWRRSNEIRERDRARELRDRRDLRRHELHGDDVDAGRRLRLLFRRRPRDEERGQEAHRRGRDHRENAPAGSRQHVRPHARRILVCLRIVTFRSQRKKPVFWITTLNVSR